MGHAYPFSRRMSCLSHPQSPQNICSERVVTVTAGETLYNLIKKVHPFASDVHSSGLPVRQSESLGFWGGGTAVISGGWHASQSTALGGH